MEIQKIRVRRVEKEYCEIAEERLLHTESDEDDMGQMTLDMFTGGG